jgi:phospho-N-acetylmuramoyl-pentapeptide-transferase
MEQLIWPLVLAFVFALVLGPAMLPVLRRLKLGQNIREDGPQAHLSKGGTPTMGGVIFLLPGIAATLLLFKNSVQWVLFAVIITAGFAVIGFLDDTVKVAMHRSLGLRPYQKMIGQIGLATVVALFAAGNANIGTTLFVPLFGYVEFGWFYVPFTVFIVVGMVNSVNLTDGLDGLAGGMSVIVCAGFAIVSFYLADRAQVVGEILRAVSLRNIAVFGSAMAGGCLGFLRFNAHPARVFMGDTGSLGLGAAISVLAVVTRMQYLLPIMGGMFIASTVSAIIQTTSFKVRGKRVFRMAPLHHHFELSGMHETTVVSMYYAITLGLSILGLISMMI